MECEVSTHEISSHSYRRFGYQVVKLCVDLLNQTILFELYILVSTLLVVHLLFLVITSHHTHDPSFVIIVPGFPKREYKDKQLEITLKDAGRGLHKVTVYRSVADGNYHSTNDSRKRSYYKIRRTNCMWASASFVTPKHSFGVTKDADAHVS